MFYEQDFKEEYDTLYVNPNTHSLYYMLPVFYEFIHIYEWFKKISEEYFKMIYGYLWGRQKKTALGWDGQRGCWNSLILLFLILKLYVAYIIEKNNLTFGMKKWSYSLETWIKFSIWLTEPWRVVKREALLPPSGHLFLLQAKSLRN